MQRAGTVRPVFLGELRSQETFRLQKPSILRLVSSSVSHQMINRRRRFNFFCHNYKNGKAGGITTPVFQYGEESFNHPNRNRAVLSFNARLPWLSVPAA